MECPSKTFLLFTSVHQVTLAPVCTWSYPRSSRKIQVHFSLYLCGIFSCAAASCYILIIIWGAHDVDAASAAIPISRLTLQFTKIVLQLANIEFSDKTCCCRCACCIHCRQVILRVPFSYESAQQGLLRANFCFDMLCLFTWAAEIQVPGVVGMYDIGMVIMMITITNTGEDARTYVDICI